MHLMLIAFSIVVRLLPLQLSKNLNEFRIKIISFLDFVTENRKITLDNFIGYRRIANEAVYVLEQSNLTRSRPLFLFNRLMNVNDKGSLIRNVLKT